MLFMLPIRLMAWIHSTTLKRYWWEEGPLPLDYLPIAVLVSEATQKIFEYLVLGRDSLQDFGMLSCRVNSLHVICGNEAATILVKFIESLINYALSSRV